MSDTSQKERDDLQRVVNALPIPVIDKERIMVYADCYAANRNIEGFIECMEVKSRRSSQVLEKVK